MGSNPNFRYSAMAPAIDGKVSSLIVVANPLGFFHDSIDQPFPEAEASHFRRNIEALHLTAAVRLDRPESNTTHRSALGIAGKQQFTSRGTY
jgi:hypothetical protein